MKKIIILVITCFLLSGCYDYKELNDVAIVSGAAISYKHKKYEVTLETIVTKKSDSGQSEESKTMLFTGKGPTPATAFNNTLASVDKKASFSHLQIVLLDESVAKSSIKHISNYLFRDIHINNTFYYILAKDVDAKKILKTKIKNEPIVTNALMDLFDNENDKELLDYHNEFDNLYAKLKSNKEDIIIPSVTLKDNKIAYGNYGIFKKDKLVDYLSSTESKTYNLLCSKVANSLYDDHKVAITIYKNKPSFKVEKDKINILIDAEARIKCFNNDDSLRTGTENKKLSKKFSKVIKKEVQKLVEKSIENESDFLGLGIEYYRHFPKNYKKDIFKQLKYDVDVNLQVNRNGQAFEVIK